MIFNINAVHKDMGPLTTDCTSALIAAAILAKSLFRTIWSTLQKVDQTALSMINVSSLTTQRQCCSKQDTELGRYQNCNLNPLELVPDSTALQQLNTRGYRGSKPASFLQFGGTKAIVRGTTRNVAGGQVQQVAAQHW